MNLTFCEMSDDVLNKLILGCVIIGVAWAIAFMIKWSMPTVYFNEQSSDDNYPRMNCTGCASPAATTAKAPPLPTKPNMAE